MSVVTLTDSETEPKGWYVNPSFFIFTMKQKKNGYYVQLMYKENGRIKRNEQYTIPEFLEGVLGYEELLFMWCTPTIRFYDRILNTERYKQYKKCKQRIKYINWAKQVMDKQIIRLINNDLLK